MKYTIEGISKEIELRVGKKLSILLDNIAENLAYSFMYSPKYTNSHELDPPWDYSGQLLKQSEKYSLKDYTCVGDFLEEYTGRSTASYVSGCGIFYTDYEEAYEDMAREFVDECFLEVLSGIDDKYLRELLLEHGYKSSELDEEEIIEMITDSEIFEEHYWYHYGILERIKLINFELFFFRGKEKAMQRYKEQLALAQERQKQMSLELEAAKKLWNKIQKLYKLQTGSQIPKIEFKDYGVFKQFLDFNQVSLEERRIMATYLGATFSNKVSRTLMGS